MTRERQFRYWIVGLIVVGLLLYLLRGVLLPFVAGMAIAYFFDPVADRLERWGCTRAMATAIIALVFVLLVLAFLGLLFPLLQKQFAQLAGRLPELGSFIWGWAQDVLVRLRGELSPEEFERLRGEVGGLLSDAAGTAGKVVANVLSGGLAILNVLSLVFITPLVAFYLLLDWDRLIGKVDAWLPRHQQEDIRGIFREIDSVLSGFVRGQGLLCLFLAVFYATGLTLAGLDAGLLVGLGAGLISFIPFVGSMAGLVVSVGLALVQFDDWVPVAVVAGVFVLGQAIEGNILQPKLVGDRVRLHPLWVIFALLAGGALLGFVGVLLAVPVAAAIGVVARFALRQYLRSPLYLGRSGPGGPA